MVARSSQPRSCPSVWLETSIVLSQKVKRVSLAKPTLRAVLDAFFVLKSKYLMRKNSHLCRTGSRGRTEERQTITDLSAHPRVAHFLHHNSPS